MSLTVRPAVDDEHAAVTAIVLSAYDAVGRMSPGYRRELADTAGRVGPESRVFVAVDGASGPAVDGAPGSAVDGAVLGTITVVSACSVHFEHPGAGDGGFRALAVAPTAQGHGIGRALVARAIAEARRAGWRRLAITTMAWMTAAQTLYEQLGFDRRPDLDVRFPTGVGHGYTHDLTADAPDVFPAPAPVPDEPPWYEDAWRDRPDRQPC